MRQRQRCLARFQKPVSWPCRSGLIRLQLWVEDETLTQIVSDCEDGGHFGGGGLLKNKTGPT
jgi:hypothetical protein